MKQRTGQETGYQQRGSHILSAHPEVLGMCEEWVTKTRGMPNGNARMLSAAEARDLVPGTSAKLVGGMVEPEAGSAEPVDAAPAMAIGARRRGATIHQFCAVRGIERSAGRVSAVITEHGRVQASTVILAGGVWAPVMADSLGLDLPVVQAFAKAMSLRPFDGPDTGVVTISGAHEVGWRKQFDGGYVVWEFSGIAPLLPRTLAHILDLLPVMRANTAAMHPRFNAATFWRWSRIGGAQPLDRPGAYEQIRIYEPEPWLDGIDIGFRRLQNTMPVFRWAPVRERWGGAMTTTPDNMPIISPVDSVPGLLIGTGFLYGLAMGAGAGALLADLAMGSKPVIDLSHYRYGRFTDGSEPGYYA